MGVEKAAILVRQAITDGVFPGAAFALGRGYEAEARTEGRFTYCPDSRSVADDTLWDLASVSKVIGTTSVAMRFFEAGLLDLDAPVASIVPAFGTNGKERVTVRQLFLHEGGLVAFRPFHKTLSEPAQVRAAVRAEGLSYEPGTKSVYSDLSMIALQEVLETLVGEPLDVLVARAIRLPETGYHPPELRCAPTERVEPWRRDLREKRGLHFANRVDIQGEVHDPTACLLGGVAGHAGLFAPLGDLVRFCAMLLDGFIAKLETVRRFTMRHSDRSTRALGWDTDLKWAGKHQGPRAFGHTGYTGTSIWLDPDDRRWAILLTNRVHPTATNEKLIPFRHVFHGALLEDD